MRFNVKRSVEESRGTSIIHYTCVCLHALLFYLITDIHRDTWIAACNMGIVWTPCRPSSPSFWLSAHTYITNSNLLLSYFSTWNCFYTDRAVRLIRIWYLFHWLWEKARICRKDIFPLLLLKHPSLYLPLSTCLLFFLLHAAI